MSEIVHSVAREAADRLAVATHTVTRDLVTATAPAGDEAAAGAVVDAPRLHTAAAAVLVLVGGACRAVGDPEAAERFLTAAELALRRFGRAVAAAERRGSISAEAALRLLERSSAVGVALAALEETSLVTAPREEAPVHKAVVAA